MVSIFQLFDPQLDLAMLFLRLILGPLMFLHGIPKLKGHKGTANFFRDMGIPFPKLNAWASFFVETIGSIFIIFGLFTQFWAFLLVGNMIVATYVQAFKEKISLIIDNGKSGYELPLLFAMGFLILFSLGGGQYSLDEILK